MAIKCQKIKSILRVRSGINTVNSKASNLSFLKELKHTEMISAILNIIEGFGKKKHVKLSLFVIKGEQLTKATT